MSNDHGDRQLQGQAVKEEQLVWLFFWDLLTTWSLKGTMLIWSNRKHSTCGTA